MSVRPAFRLLLRHGNPGGLPREFVDTMHGHYDRATRAAVLKVYRATDSIAELSAHLRIVLAGRGIPALVLWGARDPYLPVRHARANLAAFPEARIEILPDSGHWPFIDDPEAVRSRLISFLRNADVAAVAVARGRLRGRPRGPSAGVQFSLSADATRP